MDRGFFFFFKKKKKNGDGVGETKRCRPVSLIWRVNWLSDLTWLTWFMFSFFFSLSSHTSFLLQTLPALPSCLPTHTHSLIRCHDKHEIWIWLRNRNFKNSNDMISRPRLPSFPSKEQQAQNQTSTTAQKPTTQTKNSPHKRRGVFTLRNHRACDLGVWVHRRHPSWWRSCVWRVRCMWRRRGWRFRGRFWARRGFLRRSLLLSGKLISLCRGCIRVFWIRRRGERGQRKGVDDEGRGRDVLAEIRLTPPRRARRRMAGLVMPWMLSRRILRWRFAPPFPRPLPPFPPWRMLAAWLRKKKGDDDGAGSSWGSAGEEGDGQRWTMNER